MAIPMEVKKKAKEDNAIVNYSRRLHADMHKSIRLAQTSKKPESKLSRLEIAKQLLHKLKELASTNKNIIISSISLSDEQIFGNKSLSNYYCFHNIYDLDPTEITIEQLWKSAKLEILNNSEEKISIEKAKQELKSLKEKEYQQLLAEKQSARHEKETKSNISSRLTKQCADYELPIEVIPGVRVPGSKRLWMNADGVGVPPEVIALLYYEANGYHAFWCQGQTLLYLMKAASYSAMADYRILRCREGEVSHWHLPHLKTQSEKYFQGSVDCLLFEAMCLCYPSHHNDMVNAIKAATTKEVKKHANKLIDRNSNYCYVKVENVLTLWHAIGNDLLAEIARIFVKGDYAFRSGWPDLIIIRNNKLRFVEVKTTDLFHANQIRIINTFAKPLNLPFLVAHVVPIE